MEIKQFFISDLYFFNPYFSTNISIVENAINASLCSTGASYLLYLYSVSKFAMITVYHCCSTPRAEVHTVCCRSTALEFCVEDNGNIVGTTCLVMNRKLNNQR